MPQYQRKLKKGVRWYYKFSYLGITYHSKTIYHTKQEAFKAERVRYIDIENKARNINEYIDIKLLELINLRLDYIKASKSEKYYKENKYYLNILYQSLGNIDLNTIKKSDIQQILIEQSKIRKKDSKDNYAVNAMLRAFKALFFYCINYLEMDMKNPCSGIKMFPINKKIKYIPSDTEINEVLEKCNADQKLLVEFVRDTGCRISEALNLRYRDVFEGYLILYTRKSRSSNLTPRRAKFDTSKIEYSKSKDERVFNHWIKPPRFIFYYSNKEWNWHNLRHRFASKLSQDGTPLFEIMNLLGHQNVSTTQIYLQLLNNS